MVPINDNTKIRKVRSLELQVLVCRRPIGCVVAGSEGAGYLTHTVRKYRQEGIMDRISTKKERTEEQLPPQSFLEGTLLAFLQKEM